MTQMNSISNPFARQGSDKLPTIETEAGGVIGGRLISNKIELIQLFFSDDLFFLPELDRVRHHPDTVHDDIVTDGGLSSPSSVIGL